MALDFPNTPADGQIYDNYYWDEASGVWNSLGNYDIPNILSNGVFTASDQFTVPLTAKGATSQVANLQEWKNSSDTTLASLSASGGLTLNNALTVPNGGTGATTLTSGSYLKGSGTSSVTAQEVPIPIADGGTGATTVAGAQDNLRVGLVPISPSSVVAAGAGSSASANDLGKVTFATATSVSLNDVFSNDYQKYRVVWRVNTTTSAFIQMRLRVSGSDVSTSSYNTAGLAVRNTGATFTTVASLGTAFNIASANTPGQGRASGVLDLDSPFVVTQTTMVGNALGHDGTSIFGFSAGFQHVTSASYTGFSLLAGAGTILGEVQVFGYNE